MKQAIWYLLFAVMVVLSYQAYVNSQDDPETEAMSRDAVCQVDTDCGLTSQSAATMRKTDVFARHYNWPSKNGNYVATCKRDYVFFGHWKCTAQPGQLAR